MAGASASFQSKAFLKAFGESKGFLEEAALSLDVRPRARRIARRAAQLAPLGDPATDPHAGRLQEDLGILGEGSDGHGPYVDVGTKVEEGFLQEFGMSDQPPQPFMRPAIAEESR